jgi:hypothetical protein
MLACSAVNHPGRATGGEPGGGGRHGAMCGQCFCRNASIRSHSRSCADMGSADTLGGFLDLRIIFTIPA